MSDNKQCQSCSSNSGGMAIEELSRLGSLNKIKQVIAVMSGKGGVGKSTVSSLLTVELNRRGYKVGIMDADITGPSILRAFGIPGIPPESSEYGIEPPMTDTGIKIMSINLFLPHEDDPVVWRGPLLAGAVKQFWEETDWRDLDFMIVDLPPGTGDVPLTVLQTLPVSGIVIVSSPQELAQMVVKKSIKMANAIGTPIIGLVENMSHAICPHCNGEMHLFGERRADEQILEYYGIPSLGNLPWDVHLNELMDDGRIEDYNSVNLGPLVDGVLNHGADKK
ncbi:MAG TPA: Mrp/NBP35 family ATP-binding protein [Syntrophomonas sp.]|nr:Mrp/NBP35 family ATP-binding protein [Syntrophomonas sp.]